MCGRYTLTVDQEALAAALGVAVLLEDHPAPRFNVAPTQEAPVWVHPDGADPRPVRRLRWGLVPSWADSSSGAARLINARSETVATLPSFRDAFRSARCLVPVDGFYEWTSAEGRQPWWIHRPDGAVFTLAGLHARWVPPGAVGSEALDTFVVLTRAATGGIRRLHHRMPVVVPAHLRTNWLSADDDRTALLESVLAAAADEGGGLEAHAVSRAVNRPTLDEPSLVEPVEVALPPSIPLQGSLFDPPLEAGGDPPD